MRSFPLLVLLIFFLGLSSVNSQNKDGAVHMPDHFDHPYIFITGVEVSGN